VQGHCTQCRSCQAKGRQRAESRLPQKPRLGALSQGRKALGMASGAASDRTLCVSLRDGSRVCAALVLFTISAARGKQRAGRGLSPDSRKKRGLELSPEEEKLLARQVARQVTEHCVCHCVMVVVCAQRLYYSRLSLAVQGHCTQCRSWQTKGRQRAQSRLPQKARLGALSRGRKALGTASDCAVCLSLRDGSRVCAALVLFTIVTGCAGTLHSVPLVASKGPAEGSVQTPAKSEAWISLPRKKSSWHGKGLSTVCVLA